MSKCEQTASILDYWYAIELFSPQNIPRIAPSDPIEPVFAAKPEMSLPWQAVHPLQKRGIPAYLTRRYQIYCGVYRLEKVRSILEDKLGRDPESFDEHAGGETCTFSFSVTDQGRPLFDTFVLSTCAWAVGRTLDPGPQSNDWLEGFDKTANKLSNRFTECFSILQEDQEGQKLREQGFHVGRPIIYAELLQQTQHITEALGISELAEHLEIRIKFSLVSLRKQFTADDQDFLNSFFLNDLAKIAKEIRNNNIGEGLATYLKSEDELELTQRIDVRKSIPFLFQQLAPQHFPFGRWPSKDHYPLVFSQQFAVNSIKKALTRHAGLFAVNGPPGTGKTTLLRDIIAATLIERAICLAELTKPESAFKISLGWKTEKYTREIFTWQEQFKGFEIVIASSNNGAVENVTMEIPGQEAVDSQWLSEIDYFSDLASRLIGQPAWAMIAAKLGNKTNRNDFLNRFWYSDKKEENNAKDGGSEVATGFLDILKSFETEPIHWQEAVKQFKAILCEENRLREDRIKIHQAFSDLLSLQREINDLQINLQTAELRKKEIIDQMQQIQIVKIENNIVMNEIINQRHTHRQFHPGFWEIIFSWGKAFQEWHLKDKELIFKLKDAEGKLVAAQDQLTLYQKNHVQFEHDIKQVEIKITTNQQTIFVKQRELAEAQQKLGDYFPLLENWENDKAKELSSPWSDPAWNEIRARVFLAALQLHKTFIIANAKRMRKNLLGAMDILAGTVPSDAPQEAIAAAWTTLFVVVPVISTTFASFDRLFSHLKQESLGWLLIDEAGQAVPQAAVGAIWRSKRVIVVGDPLQLKPVVTLPFTVQQSLRKYYQVAEHWVPGTTSAQQLADRVSQLGTYLTVQDNPIWISSPLRVHRRCDQPMFDISNQVAYDDMMVFGTPARPPINFPLSAWLHVVSNEADGHWIPAEGVVVKQLIMELLQNGLSPEQLFLISPFRVIVRQLRIISQQFRGVKVGTIHTMQGKESDIVMLVLGGNPQKPGAKQWASELPNLLNVAVSRAKRRLYIIGDRNLWRQYPYFKLAAASLDEKNGLPIKQKLTL